MVVAGGGDGGADEVGMLVDGRDEAGEDDEELQVVLGVGTRLQQVVAIVRNFNDVFQTVSGKKEVQRQLRSILWLKYKIKDQEVFDKAYSYIEMYY